MTSTKADISLSALLTDKQKQTWRRIKDDTTKEILYGGAAGGGKSFLGSLWLHISCLTYPGTRWLMGRSELKTLKRTTLETYFDVLSKLNHGAVVQYKEQKGVIQYGNGSQILLYDLKHYPGQDPNFDGLGSLEITGAFVDEANQIIFKAKEILQSRIRYKLDEYGLIPKVLFTCNPAKNWVYQEFYKPWKEKRLDTNKAFIQALVTDNEHISQHYVEQLQSLKSKASKERLLKGNWEFDDDPDALVEYDKALDAFTNDHVPEDGRRRYITADVAMRGSDKFVVIAWYGWVAVDYVELPKSGGKEVLDAILDMKKKHRVPASNITYDSDGVGSFVGGKGGFIPNAIPFLNGSKAMAASDNRNRKENYENLKTQCYYHLAERINEGNIWLKCFDDPGIRERVIEEVEQIKSRDSDKDGLLRLIRKEDVKTILGRSPDLTDAIMMRVRFDIGKRLPQML